MQKVKNLIFVLVFFLGCMGLAKADLAGYEIEDYQADFELTSGGILKTKEQIQVNFTEPRHGIYRDIPFKYPKSDYLLETPISDVVVLGYDFRSFENGNVYRIKIGSPDYKVNGNQNYTIFYDVRGAVREFTGYQELYWNMLGTNWNTKIKNFNFSVTLPSDVALEPETEYYAVWGERGSKDRIKLEKNGKKIQNAEPLSLAPYQAVTIAVKLPEKYVPVEEFKIPKTLQDVHNIQSMEDTEFNVLGVVVGICFFSIMFLFFLFPHYKTMLQLFRKRIFFFKKKNKVKDVIYYLPPKNLSVGELAAFYTRSPNDNSVFATIYDWYARGLIDFKKNGSKKWELERKVGIDISGTSSEKILWTFMFFSSATTTFSVDDLKKRASFMKDGAKFSFDRIKKYFTAKSLEIQGEKINKTGRIFVKDNQSLIGVLPFLILLGIIQISFFLDYYLLFFISFILILVRGGFDLGMPVFQLNVLEYTPEGLELYEQVLGFRKYLKTVEEQKLKKLLEEDPHYFDKMLPYAVAFGMGTEWIYKCKSILVTNLQKSDFDDFERHFRLMKDMQSGFDALVKEVTAREERSSSSGSSRDFGSDSGFDSDGGSSGGGGGGGGGGSR